MGKKSSRSLLIAQFQKKELFPKLPLPSLPIKVMENLQSENLIISTSFLMFDIQRRMSQRKKRNATPMEMGGNVLWIFPTFNRQTKPKTVPMSPAPIEEKAHLCVAMHMPMSMPLLVSQHVPLPIPCNCRVDAHRGRDVGRDGDIFFDHD
jgi:hypothetical protein